MNIVSYLKNMCLAAKVYLGLTLVSVIYGFLTKSVSIKMLFSLIFIPVWTYLLNWLCKKGLKTLSWFLVIGPFILILGVSLGASDPSILKTSPTLSPCTSSSSSSSFKRLEKNELFLPN